MGDKSEVIPPTPAPPDALPPGDSPDETPLAAEGVIDPDPFDSLSARQRRLAQLLAEGRPPREIKEITGYCSSRISVLQHNPHVIAEVRRLQERIFEESIAARLKSMAEPALNNIKMILEDRTGRVKISEKMALSQWLVEKLDGKATQKIEAGENLLASLMDRLDAQKSARQVTNVQINNYSSSGSETREVTSRQAQIAAPEAPDSDYLTDWVTDFDSTL